MGQITIYTKELCIKYCAYTTNRNLEHSGRAFDLTNTEGDKNSQWVTIISSDMSISCEISSTPLAAQSNGWRTPNGSCYFQNTHLITAITLRISVHLLETILLLSWYATGKFLHARKKAWILTDPCWRLTEKADWRFATRRHSTAVP